MNHILNLGLLGILAGSIAGFWTRITMPDMIFEKLGNKLILWRYLKPLSCIFCLSPWICFAFCAFYILEYNPWWVYCLIGVPGCFGMSNFTVEVIKALRNG